jgi:hypothetical protein
MTTLFTSQAISTAQALLESDITLSRYGEKIEPSEGYAVGGACGSIAAMVDHPEFDPESASLEVAAWMLGHPDVDTFHSRTDSHGRRILSGVTVVEERARAEILAILRGEKVLWDYRKQECVLV